MFCFCVCVFYVLCFDFCFVLCYIVVKFCFVLHFALVYCFVLFLCFVLCFVLCFIVLDCYVFLCYVMFLLSCPITSVSFSGENSEKSKCLVFFSWTLLSLISLLYDHWSSQPITGHCAFRKGGASLRKDSWEAFRWIYIFFFFFSVFLTLHHFWIL